MVQFKYGLITLIQADPLSPAVIGQDLTYPVIGFFVIDNDFFYIIRTIVTDCPHDQVGFAVQQFGLACQFVPAQYALPRMQEIRNIRREVLFCYISGDGPDNDAHAFRFQLAGYGTQAVPFLFIADFLGNADIIHCRHQHGIAAGQADIGRHFRALAALFFLYDLDENTLTDRNAGLLDLFLRRCPRE